jgi:hypothetical protein
MTASQAKSPSAPEAIEDQLKRWILKAIVIDQGQCS